jgi:hypothetical protein
MKLHDEALSSAERDKLDYQVQLVRWKKSPSGDPPRKPVVPSPGRVVVSDVTVEAMAVVLQANPRGVLLASDELNAWFGGFDKYSKGSDASHWLSMHNSETMIVDRKTGDQRTIVVPNANVSIVGGIQPAILARALRGQLRENGMAARLLVAYPPARQKRWSERDIPPESVAVLESVIDELRTLEMEQDENGDPQPALVRMTPGAKATFTAFYDAHAAEQATLSGDLVSVWSKLEEAAARLALIIHLAAWATGEEIESDVLDEASMTAGIELSRWFGNEAKRIYSVLDESEEDTERRSVLSLAERKGGAITSRDLMRSSRKWADADLAGQMLQSLVDRGHGHWKDVLPESGGRPTRKFVVNGVDVDTTA